MRSEKYVACCFLPRRLAFPPEGDVPLIVLISTLLAQHGQHRPSWQDDLLSTTVSAPALPPGTPPILQLGVESVTATGTTVPCRHFAGLEGHCALLRLGFTIFLVTSCPGGGLGLSGKFVPDA